MTVSGSKEISAWFDVFDWPIGVDTKDNLKGLTLCVKRIEKIATQPRDNEGIAPLRVVLDGFLQGGTIALTAV